ncbi:MAG TPA: hypothetical protein PK031_10960, partial [Pseudomonadales bacterium]|nr:hypothetical protein [Pseudomonadales bacterium]
FTDYLTARKAFHAADYPTAAQGFTALSTAKSGWVKETSLYNLIRVYLRQSLPENQYGSVDFSQQDTASATLALQAINNYLQQYPDGRYAASASGLKRRAYWLQNDLDALAASYYPALQFMQQHQADGDSNGLINETDRYVLFPPQLMVANNTATPNEKPACRVAWNVPPIAATQIMLCLRDDGPMKPVPVSELLTHENAFQDAGYGDAFRLLLLTNSFYSEKNYQKVVDSTQDWQTLTTQSSYAAYSMLALRAYAFEALSQWDQSAALWSALRNMNASPLFKAYTEAAQAADLELAGNLQALFAKNSPVTNTDYRRAVIQQSASADILMLILSLEHISTDEKQRAATTLLRKDMVSANFAKLAEHYKNYASLLPDNQNWCDVTAAETLDYSCKNTAAAIDSLASIRPSTDSRLCLTIWLQQCGAVISSTGIDTNEARTLAGKSIIPGHYANDGFNKKIQDSNIFQQVLDDPKATADQRAYALYRSLQCFYHNDDNHSYGYCEGLGNRSDYPIEKREAWFRELKSRYRESSWAKAQRVYW